MDDNTSTGREKNQWQVMLDRNPGHSQWYIDRWEAMEARGDDTAGEARLIDALADRGSFILDAGSGTGRVGGELAKRGHRVVGVDYDPTLVDYARKHFPQAQWHAGDLTDLTDILGPEAAGTFDLIVSAGNVVTFLAPGTRHAVMQGCFDVLKPGGRYVAGFGTGRGYDLDDFMRDAGRAGFSESQQFSTWQLRPFDPAEGFAVVILTK